MSAHLSSSLRSIAHGLMFLLMLLLSTSCGSVGGGGSDSSGPYTMTFALDSSFQAPHGGQPISVALVRSFDGSIVAQDSGTVSATGNPSFIFSTGAVMQRGASYAVHYWIDSNIGGGTLGVCDPIEIDHQWSSEFLNIKNNVIFTVSYNPALIEDVCSTFN